MFTPVGINYVRMFLILFCGTLTIQFIWSFRDQLLFFKTSPAKTYDEMPLMFGFLKLPAVGQSLFVLSGIVFVVGLISAAAGILPRLAILVSLICYFFYFGQISSLSYIRKKTNLLAVVLLILLASPSVGQPLYEPSPQWPIFLIKFAIVQMYLSAGIQKLRKTGLKWLNGQSLRAYLVLHYLWGDMRPALKVAEHPRLCATLSVLTLMFELTVWLILLVPSSTYIYASAGMLFHLGTYATMRINYLKYLIPVYTIFVTDIAFRCLSLIRH
jgi:hypothetical protein